MLELHEESPDPSKSRSRNGFSVKRLVKRSMIYVIVIYGIWLMIGCSIERSILFPRSIAGGGVALNRPADAEVLYVDSPQGRVEGWFIPGDGVSADHPGPVVIFAHGNAELIDNWPDMLMEYSRWGVSVLLPEYRGYGRSAGTPSQKAITEDFVRFYDQIIQRPDVDPSRVILHGRSIGGSVVVQLAGQRPSTVMILQSSPSSIRRIAARFLIPWFLVRDPFDSVSVVRQYKNPILIMHGTFDNIISPSHATRLAKACTNPSSRLIWYDVDHNTIPMSDTYWDDIRQFLQDTGILK